MHVWTAVKSIRRGKIQNQQAAHVSRTSSADVPKKEPEHAAHVGTTQPAIVSMHCDKWVLLLVAVLMLLAGGAEQVSFLGC